MTPPPPPLPPSAYQEPELQCLAVGGVEEEEEEKEKLFISRPTLPLLTLNRASAGIYACTVLYSTPFLFNRWIPIFNARYLKMLHLYVQITCQRLNAVSVLLPLDQEAIHVLPASLCRPVVLYCGIYLLTTETLIHQYTCTDYRAATCLGLGPKND